jgi:hypothetical protein
MVRYPRLNHKQAAFYAQSLSGPRAIIGRKSTQLAGIFRIFS